MFCLCLFVPKGDFDEGGEEYEDGRAGRKGKKRRQRRQRRRRWREAAMKEIDEVGKEIWFGGIRMTDWTVACVSACRRAYLRPKEGRSLFYGIIVVIIYTKFTNSLCMRIPVRPSVARRHKHNPAQTNYEKILYTTPRAGPMPIFHPNYDGITNALPL